MKILLKTVMISFLSMYTHNNMIAVTPKTILHAKVICSTDSNYQPKDTDKPTQFQPYTSVIPIKKYRDGNRTCFVLVGYNPNEKNLAQEAALKIIDNIDK